MTCVGGGGLLAGIAHGMEKVGWNHVPIVAMETYGADSFNKAVKAGRAVKLEKITSCAKTLGKAVVEYFLLTFFSMNQGSESSALTLILGDRRCWDKRSALLLGL